MFKYIGGILLAILILIGGAYYYHVSAQAKEVKKETAFINNAQRTFVNSKTFADKLASYQNIKSRYAYYKANGKNNQEVLSKYQRILAQDQHYFTDQNYGRLETAFACPESSARNWQEVSTWRQINSESSSREMEGSSEPNHSV